MTLALILFTDDLPEIYASSPLARLRRRRAVRPFPPGEGRGECLGCISSMWQGIIACSRLSGCPVVVRRVVKRDTIQRGNHYPCPLEPYRAEPCYAYITRIHVGPDPTARSAPGSAGATAPGPSH